MEFQETFHGVVCCSLDGEKPVPEFLTNLLHLQETVTARGITCYPLPLNNRYYTTSLHLFDYHELEDEKKGWYLLSDCHAIVLYANGLNIGTEKLDEINRKLSGVGGEPRILICSGLTPDCETYKTVQAWCIENLYDFYGDLLDAELRSDIINSLSAYKWPRRIEVDSTPTGAADTNENQVNRENSPQLSGELMENLNKFDILLTKIRQYKDKPELRGNSADPKIEEIAEILSGLLGADVDQFDLDGDESD